MYKRINGNPQKKIYGYPKLYFDETKVVLKTKYEIHKKKIYGHPKLYFDEIKAVLKTKFENI